MSSSQQGYKYAPFFLFAQTISQKYFAASVLLYNKRTTINFGNAPIFYLILLFVSRNLAFRYQSVSNDYFIAILHIFCLFVVKQFLVLLFGRFGVFLKCLILLMLSALFCRKNFDL